MSKQFEKLSSLLKELFQTNQADLDFGIYRVINQRRDEINRFLDEELLSHVKEAFADYQAVDFSALDRDLQKAIKQAEDLGVDPEEAKKVQEIRERIVWSISSVLLNPPGVPIASTQRQHIICGSLWNK